MTKSKSSQQEAGICQFFSLSLLLGPQCGSVPRYKIQQEVYEFLTIGSSPLAWLLTAQQKVLTGRRAEGKTKESDLS